MKSVAVSLAKREFHKFVRVAQNLHKPTVITKHGAPTAILMSYAAYESLRETAIVSSDGSLMRDIRNGLRDLKAKKARRYTLDELFS